MQELQGEDLSILLPNPLPKFHRKFFRGKNFETGGGHRLMQMHSRSALVKTKSDNLIPVELNLRLNIGANFDKVEFIGVFNFFLKKKGVCVAIVSNKNKILGLSGKAEEILRVNDNVSLYNKEFGDVCKVRIHSQFQMKR